MATITGGSGPDDLVDTAGNDSISGNGGDDRIKVTGGTDSVDGGSGDDTLVIDYSAAVIGAGSSGSSIGNAGNGFIVSYSNVENFIIKTGSARDVISVTANRIEAHLGAGNDTIFADAFYGAELFGDGGDDELQSFGANDVLHGGAGTDLLKADSKVQSGLFNDNLGPGGSATPDYDIGFEGYFKNYTPADPVEFAMADRFGQLHHLQLEIGSDGITAGEIVPVFINGHFLGNLTPTGSTILPIDLSFLQIGGNDVVTIFATSGGDGNFAVYFGAYQGETGSDDYLDGGAGDDFLLGGFGNDTYVIDSLADYIEDTGGVDGIMTALPSYQLPTGIENLTGNGAGAQVLRGNSLNNSVAGSSGDDILLMNDGGNDIALGGGGSDFIYFGASLNGLDRVDGGDGQNRLILQGDYSAGLALNWTAIVGIGKIELMSGTDTRYGDTTNNRYDYDIVASSTLFLLGNQLTVDGRNLQAGEDFRFDGSAISNGFFAIYGGTGVDILTGGDGDDVLDGGPGGGDTLRGGPGSDIYFVDAASDLVYDSGGAFDAVYASGTYTLVSGQAIELLATRDSSGSDGFGLYGNDLVQTIIGNAGHNELRGYGGDDALFGGDGIDNIDGGTGADVMEGGAGGDIYFVDNAGDVVRENANEGDDWLYTSVSYALGVGSFVEQMGTRNAAGTEAIDLAGSNRDNTIVGNNGANVLNGGGGNDNLVGLGGNDLLDGGAGQDILEGGAGADRFRFEFASHSTAQAADRIRSFESGTDKIDLSLLDLNLALSGGAAFRWVGTAAFSGAAGELRYETVGSTTYVTGDANGDKIADFAITLDNTTVIAQSDFIF